MSITKLPSLPFRRFTDFRWGSSKYLAVIGLEGNGYAGDSGWTFEASTNKDATKLLKNVKHVTWSSPGSISIVDYENPAHFYSYGALPAGTVQVARVIGNGLHVPTFNDFDRFDIGGYNSANGVANYITFYLNTYYIDQDATLAFAYAQKETVEYADWAGCAVFDVKKPVDINLTIANKWQWLTLYIFTQKYFRLSDFTAYTGEGFSFPVKPIKIPSGYPSGGKYGVQYFMDASFRSHINLADNPASNLVARFDSISYLKSSVLKTKAIWPKTNTYSVMSMRLLSNSKGGILLNFNPGGNWQNLTGTPPKLTSLGTPGTTPFIWETWKP